jgi:hypothetical protein
MDRGSLLERKRLPVAGLGGMVYGGVIERQRMKQLAVILAVLVIVVLLLAVKVVSPHRRPRPECAAGHVLMLKGPHGEPVECACQSGALSACFHPGP